MFKELSSRGEWKYKAIWWRLLGVSL